VTTEVYRLSANGRPEGGLEVTVYNTATGKELRRLDGKDGPMSGVAVTADGRRVLSAPHNGPLRLWDLQTGKQLSSFKGPGGPLWHLALSPDGNILATARHTPIIQLWDVTSGKEVYKLEGHKEGPWNLFFSADGRRLYSGVGRSDSSLRVWDVATGTELRQFRSAPVCYCRMGVLPGERHAVAACSTRGMVWLTDLESGKITQLSGEGSDGSAGLAVSPDGRTVATGHDGYRLRALCHLRREHFAEMIHDTTETIRLNPRDDAVYLLRGLAQARLGNHEAASADFTAAITLNPKNAAAQFNCALFHAARKDDVRAKSDIEEAIRLDHDLARRVPAGDVPR
jgi:WD40 repeat protein